MAYNPATDFLAAWRNGGGNVSKLEIPGLDFVISALARAGVFTVSVSATAPVANQSTTAWLKAATPSYSAEGTFYLWDKVTTQYLAATPALFLQFLEACAGESGVSWSTTVGGPPLNTVGNNGDYAIRTDVPGGVYGPKAAGAWPANPLPGTTNTIESAALDNTFGNVEGTLIYRDVLLWQALAIGGANTLLFSNGAKPGWETLSTLMDAVLGSARGDILFRNATQWTALAPGAAGQVLSCGGAGADPSWAPRTAEFPSGTVMLFQQTNAPPGWTKQTTINDYGLRVTSGAVGVTTGTAFSSVFAQTSVGNTTLTIAQMPSHTHNYLHTTLPGGSVIGTASASITPTDVLTPTDTQGGSTPHTHSVSLSLAYVDVILASKN